MATKSVVSVAGYLEFDSWTVPNFIRLRGSGDARHIRTVNADVLDAMCKQFRADVFKKAGKKDARSPDSAKGKVGK